MAAETFQELVADKPEGFLSPQRSNPYRLPFIKTKPGVGTHSMD
jgi:hypothetical protein